jgi:hypothetical protein
MLNQYIPVCNTYFFIHLVYFHNVWMHLKYRNLKTLNLTISKSSTSTITSLNGTEFSLNSVSTTMSFICLRGDCYRC